MRQAPKQPEQPLFTSNHIVFDTPDEKRANLPIYMRDFPQFVHRVFRRQKPFKLDPPMTTLLASPEMMKELIQRRDKKYNQAGIEAGASNQAIHKDGSSSSSRQKRDNRNSKSLISNDSSSGKNKLGDKQERLKPLIVSRSSNPGQKNQQLSAQQANSNQSLPPPPENAKNEEKKPLAIQTIKAAKGPGVSNQISTLPSDFEHIFHYSETE